MLRKQARIETGGLEETVRNNVTKELYRVSFRTKYKEFKNAWNYMTRAEKKIVSRQIKEANNNGEER